MIVSQNTYSFLEEIFTMFFEYINILINIIIKKMLVQNNSQNLDRVKIFDLSAPAEPDK